MSSKVEKELAVFAEFGVNHTLGHLLNYIDESTLKSKFSPDELSALKALSEKAQFDDALAVENKSTEDHFVFCDVEENITKAFIEILKGQKSYVEFRGVDEEIYRRSQERAYKYAQDYLPRISVCMSHYNNTAEIIEDLERLVKSLKADAHATDGQIEREEDSSHHTGETFLFNRGCKWEFVDFGLVKELDKAGKPIVVEKKCKYLTCEGIQRDKVPYTIAVHRSQKCDKKLVWPDPVNPSKKPPSSVLPPPFKEQPWNNAVPVYADPSVGIISSDFGFRQYPLGELSYHPAIDIKISGGEGTQVVSLPITGTLERIVTDASNSINNGVYIKYGPYTFRYIHIDPNVSNLPAIGHAISPRTELGGLLKWPDGRSAHLHLEVRHPNGTALDPRQIWQILPKK